MRGTIRRGHPYAKFFLAGAKVYLSAQQCKCFAELIHVFTLKNVNLRRIMLKLVYGLPFDSVICLNMWCLDDTFSEIYAQDISVVFTHIAIMCVDTEPQWHTGSKNVSKK